MQQHAIFGRWGPKHPHLAKWGGRVALSVMSRVFSRQGIHQLDSEFGGLQLAELESSIRAGREAYVLGIATGSHNSGAALVRVSATGHMEVVCNEEEERYVAIKHCHDYPERSIDAVRERMTALGLGPRDLAACVSSWDYARSANVLLVHPVLEELPASLSLLVGDGVARERGTIGRSGAAALLQTPMRIGQQLGLDEHIPIIGMCHHDNHAYFSYAVSPFAQSADRVMVIVIDAGGDDACTSLYSAQEGQLTRLSAQGASQLDSLGRMYGVLSATLGGWPPLSSEGRYMGAAAWGDSSRLTNRYYRRLKYLFHLGGEGEVRLNRALANWTRSSWTDKPYSEEMVDILGEPIAREDMWDPDAVLNIEDIKHPEITRDRVDKAAAVQMVFEDAVIHIVDHAIRATGGHQLVLTGGTALNCVANMRLLECFDEQWYKRNLGRKNTRLQLWVPPVPGDAGTPLGAGFAFAMRAGARPGPPLRHAFYCGTAFTTSQIQAAIHADTNLESMSLGDCSSAEMLTLVADLLARLVADDRIIGLYQGVAETGPRALGHRSIVANPCNPDIRRLLNERVKHRELVRPLAPMLTRAAAERFFFLEHGAASGDYNAYSYMVLTARARPEAHEKIPAVLHHDGTGRIQIVQPEIDPFCHEYLLAMGRRLGVEASVNTSLNVAAPIAHSPEHAIGTLNRAHALDGLVMIGADGQATMVWRQDRVAARDRLMESLSPWAQRAGLALSDYSTTTDT
jgi:carbamoyltransferase